jgi:Lysylphosphatidylglycerol synthase TM region
MNKYIKSRLNYCIGIIVALILFVYIYFQILPKQDVLQSGWKMAHGNNLFLWCSIILLFVNMLLEVVKWQLLTSNVIPVTFQKVAGSYLTGMAVSVLTPGRVGEYPARVLYLYDGGASGTKRTRQAVALATVAVYAAITQVLAVVLFSIFGAVVCYQLIARNCKFVATSVSSGCTVYFVNMRHNVGEVAFWGIGISFVILFLATILLFKNRLKHKKRQPLRWQRQLSRYIRMVKRVPFNIFTAALLLSMFRYAVYSAQYLLLFKWLHADVPFWEGFGMLTLFFLVITILPSFFLADLGVRGSVGLWLFKLLTTNTAGIVAATAGVWVMNILFPAVLGSFLMVRVKVFK